MGDSSQSETVTNHPDLYDLLHGISKDEIDLYLELSQGCAGVLECGIGSGRIAIPLARAGVEVYGIDSSAEMLAVLSQKLKSELDSTQSRIHANLGNMCSFDLGRSFRLIYIPFMTFNYLLTIEAQRACLAELYRQLEPGGTILLELISFYKEWFYNDNIPRFLQRKSNASTEQEVDIYRVTRFDAATQVLEHDRHYQFLDKSGELKYERRTYLRNRFFFLGEAQLLLAQAGFTITHVWGDHAKGPYNCDSQVMILVASK